MASVIRLPNNWAPRFYQKPVWNYLENGGKRASLIWHRRAGKDDVCLHNAARFMPQKAATYWHMLPEANQARKAIWDALNPHTGKRRIDEAFPDALFEKRDQDMRVKCLYNGAIWQLCGSDNYDSLVGSPPYGVTFSEWALANPQAWAYIQPILEENGGWALFITTPRGRNHAKTFHDMAKASKDWFAQTLTVDDTDIFTKESLARIRDEYHRLFGQDEGEAKFQQEYYCSFDAALPGAYYGKEITRAEREGRITKVPYKPGVPVFPVFDFGRGAQNSTAIWYLQVVGREPRAIDYDEGNSGDIEHYGSLIKEKPYTIGKLILPHDGGHKRLATGMSYAEQFQSMGFEVEVLPRVPDLAAAITATRPFIDQCWFDAEKCEKGLDALRSYHREWDEQNKVFKPTPKHDWASHGADSFRGGAQAHEAGLLTVTAPRKKFAYDY